MLIGDSIVKYLNFKEAVVLAWRGLTTIRLSHFLENEDFFISNHKMIIIHTGINDVLNGIDSDAFEDAIRKVISLVQSKSSSPLLISSILPAPSLTTTQEEKRQHFDNILQYVCANLNIKFLASYRSLFASQGKKKHYRKKSKVTKILKEKIAQKTLTPVSVDPLLFSCDSLHLNRIGNYVLTQYFEGCFKMCL